MLTATRSAELLSMREVDIELYEPRLKWRGKTDKKVKVVSISIAVLLKREHTSWANATIGSL